jgi:hypothetical protein
MRDGPIPLFLAPIEAAESATRLDTLVRPDSRGGGRPHMSCNCYGNRSINPGRVFIKSL